MSNPSAQDEARRALAVAIDPWAFTDRSADPEDRRERQEMALAAADRVAALRAPSQDRAANVETLLREALPTLSKAGDEIRLHCPDGTITEDLYDALEAAISLPLSLERKRGEDA